MIHFKNELIRRLLKVINLVEKKDIMELSKIINDDDYLENVYREEVLKILSNFNEYSDEILDVILKEVSDVSIRKINDDVICVKRHSQDDETKYFNTELQLKHNLELVLEKNKPLINITDLIVTYKTMKEDLKHNDILNSLFKNKLLTNSLSDTDASKEKMFSDAIVYLNTILVLFKNNDTVTSYMVESKKQFMTLVDKYIGLLNSYEFLNNNNNLSYIDEIYNNINVSTLTLDVRRYEVDNSLTLDAIIELYISTAISVLEYVEAHNLLHVVYVAYLDIDLLKRILPYMYKNTDKEYLNKITIDKLFTILENYNRSIEFINDLFCIRKDDLTILLVPFIKAVVALRKYNDEIGNK